MKGKVHLRGKNGADASNYSSTVYNVFHRDARETVEGEVEMMDNGITVATEPHGPFYPRTFYPYWRIISIELDA